MAATLPVFNSKNQELMLLQTSWKTILAPGLRNPLMQGTLLKGISLQTGVNTVNHTLGRPLIGWFITRQNALSDIYDGQDTNQTPNLTLTLISAAVVTVDVYVF
jgi:hypothetical protein